jgi:hypothetical protein
MWLLFWIYFSTSLIIWFWRRNLIKIEV